MTNFSAKADKAPETKKPSNVQHGTIANRRIKILLHPKSDVRLITTKVKTQAYLVRQVEIPIVT